jgi:hypothetical protein
MAGNERTDAGAPPPPGPADPAAPVPPGAANGRSPAVDAPGQFPAPDLSLDDLGAVTGSSNATVNAVMNELTGLKQSVVESTAMDVYAKFDSLGHSVNNSNSIMAI